MAHCSWFFLRIPALVLCVLAYCPSNLVALATTSSTLTLSVSHFLTTPTGPDSYAWTADDTSADRRLHSS
jgi:hypothetical protein